MGSRSASNRNNIGEDFGSRGGIPLVDGGGRIIGALGCSGGTCSQDEVACKAGVAALQK